MATNANGGFVLELWKNKLPVLNQTCHDESTSLEGIYRIVILFNDEMDFRYVC